MLLIPDIHINSTYREKIINGIKNYISSNIEEKNIIFVWDYVYHFSYDRNSLMELYNLFFELFKQWKNVYVLAWNHDWLWSSFVFQEAQKAFEIINSVNEKENLWKIFFITKPCFHEIEWENIFFLPSLINVERWKDGNIETLKNIRLNGIRDQIKILNESENKNEQISWYINQILLDFINNNSDKNLTIIHHYYFNNTVFPWQRSRFNFKDVSLSEKFLDMQWIKFISGHLHQSFVYKNYLCVGSVWATSALEFNQIKYFFKINKQTKKIESEIVNINPYIMIDPSTLEKDLFGNSKDIKVDENMVNNYYQSIVQNSQKNFENDENIWDISFSKNNNLIFKDINLTIKVSEIDYKQIDNIVDENLRKSLKDVKLKKESISIQDLLQDFEISTKNLSTGFADWKIILKAYLEKKYQGEYKKYEKMLQKLKLI